MAPQELMDENMAAATSEKNARASLFSAVTRHLSPDKIVIFDGMNYIKGYRYQLYCAAREYKCRTCTVSAPGVWYFANPATDLSLANNQIQVAAPPDKCKEWNAERDKNRYADET
jgi:protein KTI12